MKNIKWIVLVVLVIVLFAGAAVMHADDAANAKAKPYPLKTCLVCDMQLGDMGKPYVFVYKGQEIKVCDKSEKDVFDKDPDKYMKKFADEVAKMKK